MRAATPTARFNPVNTAFLTLTPLISILGLIVYFRTGSFAWSDIVAFAVMYALTGLSITAGYHRYYAHRSYQCSKPLQLFFLLFGAATFQNSVLNWSSDHRIHHRMVDKDEDPYNIKKGFFWAHMGWIFFGEPKEVAERKHAPDFKKDALVMWQDRWYLAIAIAVGLGLPLLIGLATGHVFGAVLWAGFIRIVACHHSTFLINSWAHVIGRRPYSLQNTARDSLALAFLSFGEGYHNYHHAFPADYRNGIAWYHWDPSKWLIGAMSRFGMTWNLRRSAPATIEKAKARVRFALLNQPGRIAGEVENAGPSLAELAEAAADEFMPSESHVAKAL